MKKWILYYGTVVLAILIGALLAPQAVALHATSLVPVFCLVMLFVITSKWYFTKGGGRGSDCGFKFVKIKGEKGYFQEVHEKNVLPFEEDARRIWLAARLLAPAFFSVCRVLFSVEQTVGVAPARCVWWRRFDLPNGILAKRSQKSSSTKRKSPARATAARGAWKLEIRIREGFAKIRCSRTDALKVPLCFFFIWT